MFNDVFAFMISGPGILPDAGSNKANFALVPGPVPGTASPVSINTVNNGPFNDGVGATNPQLFVNNVGRNDSNSSRRADDGADAASLCDAGSDLSHEAGHRGCRRSHLRLVGAHQGQQPGSMLDYRGAVTAGKAGR